ncbi:MAG TPA: J domain-containing protein [Trebonia sp.]
MTTGPGGPPPDPYQVLGVGPAASGEELTRAWRQRARADHPDARPRDAAAPARFRVLAEAYRVLGDPARRAAYDQAAGRLSRQPPASGPQGRTRLTAGEEDRLAWLVLRCLAGRRERPR